MIGLVLGTTTVALYLLGMRGMSDWIPQINDLLVKTGKPKMTKQQMYKFLLLWPYTIVDDIIKDRTRP